MTGRDHGDGPGAAAGLVVGARLRLGSAAARERRRSNRHHAHSQPPGTWSHSHSMVPGGLLVTSSVTRLTSRTSLVIRGEMAAATSYGSRAQSAVMASSEVTGRSTTGWP